MKSIPSRSVCLFGTEETPPASKTLKVGLPYREHGVRKFTVY